MISACIKKGKRKKSIFEKNNDKKNMTERSSEEGGARPFKMLHGRAYFN